MNNIIKLDQEIGEFLAEYPEILKKYHQMIEEWGNWRYVQGQSEHPMVLDWDTNTR